MYQDRQRTPPDVPGYEITRLIGLGGMGEVYLARQVALNRLVAIKFLTMIPGKSPDEDDRRFRREAELMAQVSHPNVVTIFDFGTAGGRPYLVMEYVEDGDLRSRMVPDVPMKPGEIRPILGPVIRAIEYLHRQGIVHRDLKPENILMHREETPKVTDFGLAVLDFAIGSLTRVGRAMGTPGYVSPEQQYGLKVDGRADQFSMAALCYEMATGRKPLGAFPPPSRLNPRLSPGADAAIRKGLSEDPADRFPSIGEFGAALERGLSEVPGRTRRGRPAVIAGAIAISLAALIPAGLYLLGWIAPRRGPAPVREAATPGPSPTPTSAPPPRLTARSVGMELAPIPAGEFLMGSPDGDPHADKLERPSHPVRITRPYHLGVHEVTVRQFRTFVEDSGYRTDAESSGKGGFMYSMQARQIERWPQLDWRNPGVPGRQGDDEPVVQVTWHDAVKFCEWLSKKEGRLFRLPTEAEWEYACRAGTTTRWSFGDDPEAIGLYAWTYLDAHDCFHPVGSKRPNPFGLHDMHGNAWEWCQDWLGEYRAASAPVVDPVGRPKERGRAVRGGSFDWRTLEKTGSAPRINYDSDKSYLNYGFRVCSPATP